MNIPDEIFLNLPKEEQNLNATTWDTKAFNDCTNIEYIRKDAILDWLKDRIKENEKCREICPSDRFFGGKEVAFEDVKDKINSL